MDKVTITQRTNKINDDCPEYYEDTDYYESPQCPKCQSFRVTDNDGYYTCDKCDYCWR